MNTWMLAVGLAALVVLGSGLNAHGMRVLLRPERDEPTGWGIGLYGGAWTSAAIVVWLVYSVLSGPADEWTRLGTQILGGITTVACLGSALLVLGPSRHIDEETGVWAELQKLRPRIRTEWETAERTVMGIAGSGAAWGALSALAWIAGDDGIAAAGNRQLGELGPLRVETLQWAVLVAAGGASAARGIEAEKLIRP